MENLEHKNLVPAQVTGSQMDAIESKTMNSIEEAETLFNLASERLLSVNDWGELGGVSEFQLMDERGTKVMRKAEKGDYVRIDIPGPGPVSGKGYDWVKVEEILKTNNKNERLLAMRLRPCGYPLSKDPVTAHFLEDDASSTFMIRLNNKCVSAEEHGRNEQPNTAEGTIVDKSRNFVVGMAAKLGFSYPQWKLLVRGFLNQEIK